MRHLATLLSLLCLAACQGDGTLTVIDPNAASPTDGLIQPTEEPTTVPTTSGNPTAGACGDVTVHDVRLVGGVVFQNGDDAADVDVFLDDRAWENEILGGTTTNGAGQFDFLAQGVTDVEDCWGLLDYVLVAEDGQDSVEDGINPQLRTAIADGTLIVDLGPDALTL